MKKQDIVQALKEIKKGKQRKFKQSVDLVINLKKFDLKKDSINLTIGLPYKIKEKKIGAFLEKRSDLVDTITKSEFPLYQDKKKLKKLAKKYDFFIANAKLMPAIATTFGRVLGPLGKMPSPQAGIITQEKEEVIKEMVEKMEKIVKIRSKEASIKLVVGKEDMKEEDIAENILVVYDSILNSLPRKLEQIKNVMIKLTMGKPIKIKLK